MEVGKTRVIAASTDWVAWLSLRSQAVECRWL